MPLHLQVMPAVFACRQDHAQEEDTAACNNAYERHASMTQKLSQLTVPEHPHGLGLQVGESYHMWLTEPCLFKIMCKRDSLGVALYCAVQCSPFAVNILFSIALLLQLHCSCIQALRDRSLWQALLVHSTSCE